MGQLVSSTGSPASNNPFQEHVQAYFWPFWQSCTGVDSQQAGTVQGSFPWGSTCWYLEDLDRSEFISRLLKVLLRHVYPESFALGLALVHAELKKAKMRNSAENAARGAVKAMLSDFRDNIVLWSAYAQVEAESGQHKVCCYDVQEDIKCCTCKLHSDVCLHASVCFAFTLCSLVQCCSFSY